MPHSRHGLHALVPALAVALVAPPSLASQDPATRSELLALDSLLGRVVAPDSLLKLALDPGTLTTEPRSRIRRALVAGRLGEVTGDPRRFQDALDELNAAARAVPAWLLVPYARGRVRLEMSQSAAGLPATEWQAPDSTDAGKAVGALRAALALDSSSAATRDLLARAAVEQRAAPMLSLARAVRLARKAGAGDSAVRVLHRYLAAGGDSGIGYLALAVTLARGDRALEAADAHAAAVVHARSPASVARLRRELIWIADSTELAQYDRLPDSARSAWVDAFWERRDVRDARRPGERLIEHLRRLDYAEREFRRVTFRRFAGFADRYRGPPSELDDRAVIYIRHGAPDERAFFTGGFATKENQALMGTMDPETGATAPRVSESTASIPPNESWKYRRPGGDLIFHFIARQNNDYRLIESLLDVFSPDSVIALQSGVTKDWGVWNGPGYDETQFALPLFESRAAFDPVYAQLSAGTGIHGTRTLERERQEGRRSLAVGTSTDSYRLSHKAWMPAVVQGYGVMRAGGGRVLVVFAVPAGALGDPVASDSGLVYPLQFRLVLSTPDERRIAQLDTVRTFIVRKDLGDRDYLTGYFELPAPAGPGRLRAVVVSPRRDVAGSTPVLALTVPAAGGGLVLSDVVPGSSSSKLEWAGPDGPVALNPLGAYRKGGEARVYYQVSGLKRGETIQTTIDIAPADPSKGRNRVASTFTAQAEGGRQGEQREIGLGGLKPGAYVLTVTVHAGAGTAARTTSILITKH